MAQGGSVVTKEWRLVIIGLQVSNLGRVMRRGRLVHAPKGHLCVKGRGKVNIGRLVLEVFVGPCPEGMECCHYDDDRTYNALTKWARQVWALDPKLWSYGKIAIKLGVSKKAVQKLLQRKTWEHVP